jgi:hypothetical protein
VILRFSTDPISTVILKGQSIFSLLLMTVLIEIYRSFVTRPLPTAISAGKAGAAIGLRYVVHWSMKQRGG